MASKRAAIPGEAEPTAEAAAPAAAVDHRAERMGLPDFSQKSCAYAEQWFKDHPEMAKRNVLTAEGWFVHPLPPMGTRGAMS